MKFINNFKRVLKYSKGCRKYLVVYFILSLTMSLIGILVPYLTSLQLVQLTAGIWNKVILVSIFVFLVRIFNRIIGFFSSFATEKFSKIVVSKVQLELGKELLSIKVEDIDKHSNGVFIQRLTRDAYDITSIFTSGVSIFNNILQDIGVTILVFITNVYIGLYFVLYLIVSLILQHIRTKMLETKENDLRNQRESTSGFSTELVRGIRDIKMLNAENSFLKKVQSNIEDLNNKDYDISFTYRLFSIFETICNQMYELFLVFIIVYFVKHEAFDIATGVVIYNYRNYILSLVYDATYIIDFIRGFNISCERVFALFGSEEFKKEKFGAVHLDHINGDFEFKNVEFSYDTNKVLDKLSFKVNANETVGFVGKSGAGKTTIFSLLCKLYDIDKGKITIDGVDINELDKDSIRGNITIISQNPYIFNMSIKDNLKLVKEDMTDEEMYEACKLACLDDFIEALDQKYDTIIGEGGVTLSGGQRQRLAIARALIQKTEIILFDEATSALDNETQTKIQKSIENMKSEYTIMIIAHRLSTIINCDRIVFIDKGKVVAQGTHKELLKNCKAYKALYESESIEK
ncbi:MAG: ABC transporter ATP-binding protein [Bacilli bacterium]|nr:ABC transporter ATP-binding protein [Bacilli bacterium]